MRLIRLVMLAWFMAACGEVTALTLDVGLAGLRVPGELDTLHVELARGPDYLAERSFALEPGATRASLTIEPGAHTPRTLTVTVFGDLNGAAVARSIPIVARFADGEVKPLSIELQP